ncbi:TonB-dependent receptor [Antarcticibacterium flavum]|uniref:TonB-dependent receptor n=1 Tax=Antarcticibacterium flavum TaxID=2058175 RepID=A0A5B7X6M4_9FLAO|nr:MULTISPECIES: outer membrane beta-barrel protein [Antarcticibacterium]MCM4159548.1 TonB-dependent receptor [Antarcticibacterium sp. W02-3]QCY70800.1 TonB-dependent receptor [Antarcticibacterium flavum]
MKKIFFAVLCLAGLQLTAQTFEISGRITDTETNLALEAATVYAENSADSTLVSYTISEKDGDFILTGNTTAPNLNLFISFTGFQLHRQSINLSEKMVHSLGTIRLQEADNTLDEVQLVGSRAPITIKRDTLEFNAGSFATRPDANLEELMKKLPGVEVDIQGNITVNGKPVSRILVDGKEFFGNDPKIATRNLPKEIIDKIQVTDTKTRAEEFTGKAGNPDDKTINITLQKDKNKGYFARATVGGGTNDRYEMSGIGNYFKDKFRVSVLASSNNINSSGFSFDEVFDMMGRNARSFSFNSGGGGSFGINGMNFGGGAGITKAETAGLNLVNEWGKTAELNADYFFGRNDTETMTVVERENLLPDSRFFYNSTSSSNLVNDSHRANARFEYKPDTLTRISFAPRFSSNTGYSNRSNSAASSNENRELVNSTETIDDEYLNSQSFSNRLDVIRRYGSRGAYSQLNFTNSHQRQENDNYFFSESRFFAGEETVEIQDQFIDEDQKENEYSIGATQRFVMAEKLFLDASYNFSSTNSNNTRYVYDLDQETNSYSIFNDLLSSDFESKSFKNIPNVGVNYEGQKWRVGSEIGLLNTTLENTNFLQDVPFDNTYNNLFLRANVRYEIARSKSVYLNYNSDAGIPSIRQLQPVVNRTNPLNIFVGNPDLRPTFTQTIRGGYRNYDFSKRSGFFSYASVTFTDNSIVPVTTTGADLVRTTTYANVDGAINSNAGASYSKQNKKDGREFSYRLGLNGNYDRNIGFTNGVQFRADRYTVRPSINLTYGIEDYFSINPGYQLAFTETQYDIIANRNENFTNHTVSLEATTFWPKNFVFGNDISYTYFGNVSPGFDNTAFLWNISLGYKFLNDDATLKIKVYDMLNENVSTQRIVGDDFIQDTQNLILRRYAMLSFTYKLSKFGGKDPNQSGRRMMRM